MAKLCEELGIIQQKCSSVAHPQTNGLTEAINNKTLLEAFNKRVKAALRIRLHTSFLSSRFDSQYIRWKESTTLLLRDRQIPVTKPVNQER